MRGDAVALEQLSAAVERAHFEDRPVDATFCGIAGFDDLLPPAGNAALAEERRRIERFESAFAALDRDGLLEPGERIDAHHVGAWLAQRRFELDERHRTSVPSWYTGEAAFGLISLLLPSDAERDPASLGRRIAALPDFFDAGTRALAERPLPPGWCERARNEAAALERLLAAIARGEFAALTPAPPEAAFEAARAALASFVAGLERREPASAACGGAVFAQLLRRVHGIEGELGALEREAERAYDEARDALEERARRLDAARSWRTQLDDVARDGPQRAADVLDAYRAADRRACELGDALVPAARDYELAYEELPPWARAIASDLYFLFYRSPAAFAPGAGSVYFVAPAEGAPGEIARAHAYASIKEVHAVHHGSVGHHTQNAFARRAPSRFARFAGNDCASGIASLAAGTIAEGWATYVTDALDEIDGFYTERERLALAHSRMRLAASALADLRLHTAVWTIDDVRRFYRDDVGFAPARIESEITRNSIFPTSRYMYWAGNRAIRALRARASVPVRAFHAALLEQGHAAVAWSADELRRSGVVR